MSAETTNRLLVEAVRTFCEGTGRGFRSMSHDWLLQILDPAGNHLIFGYDLGLNRSASQQIADDKSATADVLAAAGVPHIEHALFHAPDHRPYAPESGNWASMLALFERWREDVVCKAHEGTAGEQVFRARTRLELEECVHRLFAAGRALTISPYVEFADECRVVLLDGEAELVYRKRRRTDWRHNLAYGARPVPVGEAEAAPLVRLAAEAAEALGLRFASVDIAEAAEPRVLEVNAGVMMESFAASSPANRERALAIYHRALERALKA